METFSPAELKQVDDVIFSVLSGEEIVRKKNLKKKKK
jgi:hypothetical protein